MIYEIKRNPDGSFFPDIVRANYYDENDELSKVLYKVSTKKLIGYDILETDFKYFSEKKFSDGISLDYLTEEDKQRITGASESAEEIDRSAGLEKYFITLFPTLVKSDEEKENYDISFFGSILNPSYELIILQVPSGISRIVLKSSTTPLDNDYDTIQINFSNEDIEKGKQEWYTNKSVYLYLTYNKPDEYKWKELKLENDDIDLWVRNNLINPENHVETINDLELLSIEDDQVGIIYYVEETKQYYRYLRSVDFNLSYICWIYDINGNPKMSDYVLRRDGYNKGLGYPTKLGYDNLLYSTASGSLIGTDIIPERKLYNTCSSCNKWNRYKKYGAGEVVKLSENGVEYESLIPKNIGNHPFYSNAWVVKGSLDNFLNRQIQINTSVINDDLEREFSSDSGVVSPSGIISIPRILNNNYSRDFSIKPNICYMFYGIYSGNKLLNEGEDYIKKSDTEISIRNWTDETIIDNGFEFCFSKNLGKLSFVFSYNISEEEIKTFIPEQLIATIKNRNYRGTKSFIGGVSQFYARVFDDVTGDEIQFSDWYYKSKYISVYGPEEEPNTQIGINVNTKMTIDYFTLLPSEKTMSKRIIVEYIDSHNEVKYKEINQKDVEIEDLTSETRLTFHDTFEYQTTYNSDYSTNDEGMSEYFKEVRYPRYYVFCLKGMIEIMIFNEISDSVMVKTEYEKIDVSGDDYLGYNFEFYLTDSSIITKNAEGDYEGVTIYYRLDKSSEWKEFSEYYDSTQASDEKNKKLQYNNESDTYFCVFEKLFDSIEIKIC